MTAARIDRQLIGRCGRQGDPAPIDNIFHWMTISFALGLGGVRAESLKRFGKKKRWGIPCIGGLVSKGRNVESNESTFRDRMALMHQERERTKIQRENGTRSISGHRAVKALSDAPAM